VCECAPGYAGTVCDIYVGFCNPNPCANGGTCVDEMDDFSCRCPDGFSGKTCEIETKVCEPNPCKNGGECSPETGGEFSCDCPAGLEPPTCETGTIRILAENRGWWEVTGRHDSDNNNTLTGNCACGTTQTNSYFSFPIPSFDGNVTALSVRLEHESYVSNDPSEAFTVYDVSTDAMTLEASGSGMAGTVVHNDLQTGSLYATFILSDATVGTVPELRLADQAISDLVAKKGSTFSIGVHLATLSTRNNAEYARFSSSMEARIHELVLELGP
jgi:hypothetical protein